MCRKLVIIALVYIATHFSLQAQETGEDDLGSWFLYFGTHRIADKWSIHTDIQYHTYQIGEGLNRAIGNVGLNYHINAKASVSINYCLVRIDPSFEDTTGEEGLRENRIYEQLTLKDNLKKLKFIHRIRLEHRFINFTVRENEVQHRARYLLRLSYPINDRWFLTAFDEIIIGLQEPLFDQNRLYGALGYTMSKSISLQLGYLKHHFTCLLYTSPSPRDLSTSRMPSSA